MTIYRGTGGGGNATTDTEVALLTQLEQSAVAAAAAAEAAQAAALLAATEAAESASSIEGDVASAEAARIAAEAAQEAAEEAQDAAVTAQGLAEDARDAALAAEAALENVYTKDEADDLLDLKANTSDVNDALALKANQATTYTKTEADAKFVNATGDTMTGDLTLASNLNFSGNARRITGDFSNATVANRVAFQTSTVNGATSIEVIPNGTSVSTGLFLESDPTFAASSTLGLTMVGGTDARIQSFIRGTGTPLPMTFYTGGTERMRIDSSGNLLVGTTSTNVTAGGISLGGGAGGYSQLYRNSSTAGDGAVDIYSNWGSTKRNVFRINTDGNVLNWNNSYGSISDAKLKENIVDATPKLQDLMQVRVRNYNLIGDEGKQIGVVAQELEQVFPGLVSETPDRDEEGNDLGTTTKSVKYSVFVPMLIKAIQEQQTIITALTARVEALERTNSD